MTFNDWRDKKATWINHKQLLEPVMYNIVYHLCKAAWKASKDDS